VDFLSRLENGEKLLALDELSLNAGSAIPIRRARGARSATTSQLFAWSLRLHGLYRATGGANGS
jgi:hypothetical protein